MQYDSSTWANIATAVAAWFALAPSLLSLVVSWRALRLTEHQERRRRPLLVPYLSDGYVRFISDTGARIYGFLLSVSNPADSDNAVAEADLRLTYRRADEPTTVKVRSDAALGAAFGNRSGQTLSTPARIDAHQTVLGWVFFRLDKAVVKDGTVEALRRGPSR